MYAAKRKFNHLLESISGDGPASTGPSATSQAPDAEPPAPPADRGSRYVQQHAERLPNRERRRRDIGHSPSPPDRRKARKTHQAPVAPSSSELAELPNYTPWSREKFLERLKTFRHVDQWSVKPDRVNEVQWAKRGWTCVGKERVGCVGGCGKEVCIELGASEHRVDGDADDAEEQARAAPESDWIMRASGDHLPRGSRAEDALIVRYVDLIVTGHDDDCWWRKRGCRDDIYQYAPTMHEPKLEAFWARYASLLAIGGRLPRKMDHPPTLGDDWHQLAWALTAEMSGELAEVSGRPDSRGVMPERDDHGTRRSEDGPGWSDARSHMHEELVGRGLPDEVPEVAAVLLALFGWRADGTDLITCEACFRRVGLWRYRNIARGDVPPSDPERRTEEPGGELLSSLDVAQEHRDYCPWINRTTNGGPGPNRGPRWIGCPWKETPSAQWDVLVRSIVDWLDMRRMVDYQNLKRWTRWFQKSKRAVRRARVRDGYPVTESEWERESESESESESEIQGRSLEQPGQDDAATWDAKDKERLAKVKELKKAFDVKDLKRKRDAQRRRPERGTSSLRCRESNAVRF